jgi:hypothetical protein
MTYRFEKDPDGGILSDYDGLLGLDFFENTVLCIDMKNHTIEVIPQTD